MRDVCLLGYPWSYQCWSKEIGHYDVNLLVYPWIQGVIQVGVQKPDHIL